LELLGVVKIHLVVNVSKICRYKDQIVGQRVVLPLLVVIENEEEYEVKKILRKKKRYSVMTQSRTSNFHRHLSDSSIT